MCAADSGACKNHYCDHCKLCERNICCRRDRIKDPAKTTKAPN